MVLQSRSTYTDEKLRAAGIELSSATQYVYKKNPATLFWNTRLDLYDALRDYAVSHGIHDTWVDRNVIDTLRKTRHGKEIADRLMTESVMRTAMEISNQSNVNKISDAFITAMNPRNNGEAAQRIIEHAIDATRPQDPIYDHMREKYWNLLAEKENNLNDPELVSLRVNMRRVRQEGAGDTPERNEILVNVAAGQMFYKIGDAPIVESRVMIGTNKTGRHETRTPIGEKGKVTGVLLHQPWRVGRDVAESLGLMAKIPFLKTDPKTGAQYYVEPGPNGRRFEYDPAFKDHPMRSPFTMNPAPNCPMGTMKISLGGVLGERSIFIHDTSAKFSTTSFARSFGCIRTEGIADLATALTHAPNLGQQNGFKNNRAMFHATRETRWDPETKRNVLRYNLSHVKVPIHDVSAKTVYHTVTLDRKNKQDPKIIIHPDIYKRDAKEDKILSINAMPSLQIKDGRLRATHVPPTKVPASTLKLSL